MGGGGGIPLKKMALLGTFSKQLTNIHYTFSYEYVRLLTDLEVVNAGRDLAFLPLSPSQKR